MRAAAIVYWIVNLYGLAGALSAVPFLLGGIDRVSPGARLSYAFRPLLMPGIILLWPLVLWRWSKLEGKGEGNAAIPSHRA